MILGTEKLQELIKNSHSEMNLLHKSIRGASVDLRINNEVGVIKECYKDKTLNLAEFDDIDDLLKDKLDTVDLAKEYELKSGCYLYGKSFEEIKMPENMCGIVIGRSSFARVGVILPISQFVNPGYHGNLPIIIYNASPMSIIIPPYYRVAQIIFMEVDGDTCAYGLQQDAKYHNEKTFDRQASFNDIEFREKRLMSEQDILDIINKGK